MQKSIILNTKFIIVCTFLICEIGFVVGDAVSDDWIDTMFERFDVTTRAIPLRTSGRCLTDCLSPSQVNSTIDKSEWEPLVMHLKETEMVEVTVEVPHGRSSGSNLVVQTEGRAVTIVIPQGKVT